MASIRQILLMPDRKKTYLEEAEATIQDFLSEKLGIDRNFVSSLAKDDDWTYVIKLHALLEAALNHLIIDALKEERLAAFVARLETSNNSSGKLAIIKELELMSKELRAFVKCFSEMRNSFVHDVKNVGTTISGYISSSEQQKRKAIRSNLLGAYPKSYIDLDRSGELADKERPMEEIVDKSARVIILLNVIQILGFSCGVENAAGLTNVSN